MVLVVVVNKQLIKQVIKRISIFYEYRLHILETFSKMNTKKQFFHCPPKIALN